MKVAAILGAVFLMLLVVTPATPVGTSLRGRVAALEHFARCLSTGSFSVTEYGLGNNDGYLYRTDNGAAIVTSALDTTQPLDAPDAVMPQIDPRCKGRIFK